MIGPDAALAAIINRSATAYQTAPPAFITYRETSHIEAANRTEDINRYVVVRVADDCAIMQDLPHGAQRTGAAFPVIPFFDPFSSFRFSYFANLKKVDITFDPGQAFQLPAPPTPAPGIDSVITYFSEYAPRYAPDSTDDAVHLLIDPTPLTGKALYFSEVLEDAQTQLPSHVTLQDNASDMQIGLDYSIVDGHWVITRGTWSATQHVPIFGDFKVSAVVTYSDFTFPTTAPDPRLAGTPRPSPSPSASPAPCP